ncbi:Metalloendopeptidase OMA1, mitochondrial [Hypsibius exemplaris]|uniref:Metalloendopeptidase OMA1, mitochondrial n=1 Tax=Hypsibius exemplaris TaxID=2072580 RepID=A0A1W0WMB7_HYPEX|nr:Metalloendopeptidase OMA1, mitochondrial [Hypsibius exemplaris]
MILRAVRLRPEQFFFRTDRSNLWTWSGRSAQPGFPANVVSRTTLSPSESLLLRSLKPGDKCLVHREFQTTCVRNFAFPPLIAAVIRLVGKPVAVLVGRYVRNKWAELPKEQRAGLFQAHRHKLAIATVGLALFGFVYYEMHIEETPFTKRRRFIVFTQKQFAEVAEQQRKMLFESMKDKLLPAKHPAYAQVNRVAQRLIRANNDIPIIHDQKWSVTLIGDKEKNAFVLPTGHIFVFLGMLEMVANDDQLGVVLGHEMAHTILGHGAEQVSVSHFVDYFVIIVMSALWAILPSDVISGFSTYVMNKIVDVMLHLPYSRLLETEADEVGLRLSAKACFDVRESVSFWQRMNIVSHFEGDVAAQVPEFLSTHPTHETRAQKLEESVPKALELRKECNCPPLPLRNPQLDVAALKAKLSKADAVDDPWKPFIVVIK